MNRYMLIIGLLAILLSTVTVSAQWTVPRQVIQEIYDYGSVYPDSVSYPEEGTITFRAFIKERPEYVLTEEHPSSYATISGGLFGVVFNLGNFPVLTDSPRDWSYGETVRIEVEHTPTGRVGYSEFIIEGRSGPIIRSKEKAIILADPPAEDD